MHPDPSPTADAPTGRRAGRRAADRAGHGWLDTRDLLLASLAAPLRTRSRVLAVLALAVVLTETTGLVARRACAVADCGGAAAAWALRLDMDALGSVPRTLVTAVLAATALACLRGARRSGHGGAQVWWVVLAAGCTVLAAAKATSVHSVVEGRLAGVVPGVDVQLLFVVVSLLGLLVALVTGRWVRRGTRTLVVTWLALYAAASVGLAAVSVVVVPLGAAVVDLSTYVEETGEGLAAVGLLAAVLVAGRDLAARRPSGAAPSDHAG